MEYAGAQDRGAAIATTSENQIEFVAEETPRKELPCPICGEAVGAAPTTCPHCDTPHHFDCWEYAGGCGVYGCASKPKEEPRPEVNTVDLPAKLGLPHKKTGSYAGVWWVPPIAGFLSVAFEVMAIGAFASGSGMGTVWSLCMVATLVWIAFSSVHYYVDFDKMRISTAKAFLGKDLIEWGVVSLDRIDHLEVRRMLGPVEHLLNAGEHPSTSLPPGPQAQFRVLAVYKQSGMFTPQTLEICPPLLFGEDSMRDVADLFRRIEASKAFPVRLHDAVRKLPPPAENQLLLEAQKNS